MLYTDILRDATRKLLEIISEFSKVSGYKISIHKSLGSLYTNNEKSERKTKGTTIFTTCNNNNNNRIPRNDPT